MTWLMENPVSILAAGVVIEIILAAILLQSGRGMILGIMLLVAVLTGGLIVAERLVVTDSEAIRGTLDGVAAALEANDVQRVLTYLATDAEEVRQKAQAIVPRLVFREARIGGDVNLHFQRLAHPQKATARFLAHFNIQERHGGTFGHDQQIVRLTVELQKSGDRWVITAAEPDDRQLMGKR